MFFAMCLLFRIEIGIFVWGQESIHSFINVSVQCCFTPRLVILESEFLFFENFNKTRNAICYWLFVKISSFCKHRVFKCRNYVTYKVKSKNQIESCFHKKTADRQTYKQMTDYHKMVSPLIDFWHINAKLRKILF